MNKIEARNIYKKFQNLEVLKGIDLEVAEGEVVAVIGPSGGGKSTLLRCLNKLETIDRGSIIIDGETLVKDTGSGVEYAAEKDSRRIACKMGMVFQQFNLFPHMTVMENLIEAPVQVQKRNKEEVIREAEVLLAKVGLLDKRDVYPRKLSGGQQQRVAIARALITKPEVVFADEPTGNLDSKSGKIVIDALKDINEHMGKTIIMVTHDPQMASYCSRLILLKDGVILEDLKNSGDQEAFYQEILGKMKEL